MLDRDAAFEAKQREWLAAQFESIPDELKVLRPSEWAEKHRYLPASVTSLPGPFSFGVTPYSREILDCFSVDSPIREVTFMKGVQICATVSVLENAIGYAIEHVRTAPVMMVTAEADLAKTRLEVNIKPMLEHSGLRHLIRSSDETNARKTGNTDKKIEWEGGGFLIPVGSRNPNNFRSLSIEWLLNDELDSWPERAGKDGDTVRVARDRTAAYEASRKILNISTPTLKGQSKIAERYAQGDQRKYFVCCLSCGFPQVLRWRGTTDDGVVFGMVWDAPNGVLDVGSIRYLCEKCQHPHVNDDKERLLDPSNGAEWRPTAEPKDPHHRSYHLSALYSPVGMQTWAACVEKWLDAWDVEHNRSKDNGKLQVFYNNVLGDPFELRGERVRMDAVSKHRRSEYRFGELPNALAQKTSLGPILLVTCAADVQGDCLKVAAVGWTRGSRCFLLNYWTLEGDTSRKDDPGSWGALRELLIRPQHYVADDGKRYRIQLTLIDSGYRADVVYDFVSDFQAGVYPVKGREIPAKAATFKEFSSFETPMGTTGYAITVDIYKDRWSSALRREWDGISIQPAGHFNAPVDVTEAQLKELTVETKVPKPGTDRGYEWKRPSGAPNELWDLLVYNRAGLDMIAENVCRGQLGMDAVDWGEFWRICEQNKAYFATS